MIAFVIKAFCEPGDNIVTADRTFAVYEWVATFSGLEARLAPLKDFGFDEAELWPAWRKAKVIFICTRTTPRHLVGPGALVRFLVRVDRRQIVVLDEAYAGVVDRPGYPDGLRLLADHPNLVVFRTFSKMFGLAGLRIGYLASSPEVVDVIRRVCVVYSVNALAQAAALASLSDADRHVAATRSYLAEQRAYLLGELARLGLTVQAGDGCYVMVHLPMSDTQAHRRLLAEGVMVRAMTGFRFPNWIRVSLGPRPALEEFVAALARVLGR